MGRRTCEVTQREVEKSFESSVGHYVEEGWCAWPLFGLRGEGEWQGRSGSENQFGGLGSGVRGAGRGERGESAAR
jgi:hypothetical protein